MTKALIIVDVQNDFVEGGSLAVTGGREVARKISEDLLNVYDVIVTTQDWHIDPGTHFAEEPDFVDSWPVHCVADTSGSDIVEPLRSALKDKVNIAVRKGMFTAAYSGFEGVSQNGKTLSEELNAVSVTDVVVVGIATDHCVRATALDALSAGFNVTVLKNYVVGVSPERSENTLNVDLPAVGIDVL